MSLEPGYGCTHYIDREWSEVLQDFLSDELHPAFEATGFLEVIFDSKPGHFRETSNDHVMEKVDDEGNILGFSVLKVSALKQAPLEVAL